jgi:hypothetical protein
LSEKPVPVPLLPSKRRALTVLGVAGAVALLGSGFWVVHEKVPKCWLLTLSGIPCPTCGGTRAIRALLAGDLVACFLHNPFVAISLSGLLLSATYALGALLFRWPVPSLPDPASRSGIILRGGLVCSLIGSWIWVYFRYRHGQG